MTIDDVVAATADLVARTPDGHPAEIDVNDLVFRIAERVEKGELVVRRHPVGFLHVDVSALGGAPHEVEFRLHLWNHPEPRRDGLGNLHDHGWNMASAVLIGELEETNFTAANSPDGEVAFVRVTYTAEGNDFTQEGNCSITEVRRRRVPAPLVYRLGPRLLHRSAVVKSPTITFLVADRRSVGPYQPLVVVAAEEAPRSVGLRPVIPPQDAAEMLRAAISGQ
ncbi:hypothetical protein [Streptomyces sp. HUAS ZL42]|uniref:hypothetical protein n=1 Tax=Streptomyces sp. HUAS ZL42 TaxID=3231715 RepID=UPI00345EAFC2